MTEKPLHWVGSAKRDLLALPAEAVDDIGADYEVRYGKEE